jgi:hypothetical protein
MTTYNTHQLPSLTLSRGAIAAGASPARVALTPRSPNIRRLCSPFENAPLLITQATATPQKPP